MRRGLEGKRIFGGGGVKAVRRRRWREGGGVTYSLISATLPGRTLWLMVVSMDSERGVRVLLDSRRLSVRITSSEIL